MAATCRHTIDCLQEEMKHIPAKYITHKVRVNLSIVLDPPRDLPDRDYCSFADRSGLTPQIRDWLDSQKTERKTSSIGKILEYLINKHGDSYTVYSVYKTLCDMRSDGKRVIKEGMPEIRRMFNQGSRPGVEHCEPESLVDNVEDNPPPYTAHCPPPPPYTAQYPENDIRNHLIMADVLIIGNQNDAGCQPVEISDNFMNSGLPRNMHPQSQESSAAGQRHINGVDHHVMMRRPVAEENSHFSNGRCSVQRSSGNAGPVCAPQARYLEPHSQQRSITDMEELKLALPASNLSRGRDAPEERGILLPHSAHLERRTLPTHAGLLEQRTHGRVSMEQVAKHPNSTETNRRPSSFPIGQSPHCRYLAHNRPVSDGSLCGHPGACPCPVPGQPPSQFFPPSGMSSAKPTSSGCPVPPTRLNPYAQTYTSYPASTQSNGMHQEGYFKQVLTSNGAVSKHPSENFWPVSLNHGAVKKPMQTSKEGDADRLSSNSGLRWSMATNTYEVWFSRGYHNLKCSIRSLSECDSLKPPLRIPSSLCLQQRKTSTASLASLGGFVFILAADADTDRLKKPVQDFTSYLQAHRVPHVLIHSCHNEPMLFLSKGMKKSLPQGATNRTSPDFIMTCYERAAKVVVMVSPGYLRYTDEFIEGATEAQSPWQALIRSCHERLKVEYMERKEKDFRVLPVLLRDMNTTRDHLPFFLPKVFYCFPSSSEKDDVIQCLKDIR